MPQSRRNARAVRVFAILGAIVGTFPATVALAEGVPPYWIVSSRFCPQTPDGIRRGPCPKVVRIDPREPAMAARFEDLVASIDPARPVVVYVHGSYNEIGTSISDAQRLFRWLDAGGDGQTQYLVFAWPSSAVTFVLPSVDVNLLGRRAEFNGYYLARLVSSLPAETPVTLVGHSHGTRVIAGALHLRGGGVLRGFRLPPIPDRDRPVRAVFLAAAMDEHWMAPRERYGRAWQAVDGVLNLRNRSDAALNVYALRRPFAHHALGREGFDPRMLAAIGESANGVVEIDVTRTVGSGHLVADYTRHPQLAGQIRPYVLHQQPLVSNRTPSTPVPRNSMLQYRGVPVRRDR